MLNQLKLLVGISGETHSVTGVVISNESGWLSIAVKSLDDAFKMCYCYRNMPSTRIDKLPTNEFGEYLVVVYKK